MAPPLAYRAVRALLVGAVAVFFRELRVTGRAHIPEDAPVIFVGNHPNSLIDPVLVIATCGRQVSFAAKDALFRPPLGVFLRAVGAVPIARRMDHGDGPRDNEGSLQALCDVIAHGGTMGIFPEGLSHDRPQLQRMRAGAARIALQVAGRPERPPVTIVPVGLTYVRRRRFRSRALVHYGEPLHVTPDEVALAQDDSVAAASALTERIEVALRGITVNAEAWETVRVLDGVRRLYQPPKVSLVERTELMRRFCLYYPTVAHHPEVAALFARVGRFLDELDDSGLSDRDLVRGLHGRSLVQRCLGNLAAVLIWLPLSLPGAPLHVPLLLLVGYAGIWFAPRKDVIGTSRLILGLVAVGLAYVVGPLLLAFFVGWGVALVAAALLPLSGLATLRLLERGGSLRRVLRSAWASLSLRHRICSLRAERAELQERIVAVVQRFKPEEIELLFPRDAGA